MAHPPLGEEECTRGPPCFWMGNSARLCQEKICQHCCTFFHLHVSELQWNQYPQGHTALPTPVNTDRPEAQSLLHELY